MEEVHIWDLERVHIKIKKEFLEKLNKEIALQFKSKRKAHSNIFKNNEIPSSTFKNILKPSYMRDFFVPLEIYMKTTESLSLSKYDLEKNIIAYKTAGGGNHIKYPILPIRITPVFDMLIAHHIADGTVINPKRGRLPYFGYRQFDELYRLAYIKKIESIFGKISFKKDYIKDSTRPYCPPILSTLFFKYYNLNEKSFLSKKARIPKGILDKKEKDNLLAILIAEIIDEGNIDSTLIAISVKNEGLIRDLNEICSVLGYKTKVSRKLKENGWYDCLYILREGMKKLYGDYIILNKKYPCIDLGWKGEKIVQSLKIDDREIIRKKGNKNLILKLLHNEDLSVNQLALRLNMTRQGIRYHIHNLLKENKIKIIDKKQPNWLYGAKK